MINLENIQIKLLKNRLDLVEMVGVVYNHITDVYSTAPVSVARPSLPIWCRDRCRLGKSWKTSVTSGGLSSPPKKCKKCAKKLISPPGMLPGRSGGGNISGVIGCRQSTLLMAKIFRPYCPG